MGYLTCTERMYTDVCGSEMPVSHIVCNVKSVVTLSVQ